MKRRRELDGLLLGMLMISGCLDTDGATVPGAKEKSQQGILAGAIMRSPTCPVQRVNVPCPPEPASGAKILVLMPAGKQVRSVAADREGKYSVTLPAGSYRIESEPLQGLEFTRDLPTTVSVTAGGETRLDITIDTGMR
jgi:hypothetical protein